MPRKKTTRLVGRPDIRRSVTFAPDTLRLLTRLSQDATEETRRRSPRTAVERRIVPTSKASASHPHQTPAP